MRSNSLKDPFQTLVGAALALCVVGAPTAMAATQAEINNAIDKGLTYLEGTQAAGGYWNYGGYEQATTGAAVFAMLSQRSQWGANTAAYQAEVDKGINYLLQSASLMNGAPNGISTRNDGVNICPGGAGSCTGVYWYGAGEATYTTGQVAMAIAEYAKATPNAVATATGPLAGMTWKQIAQGVINSYAASQSTAVNGNKDGGWRYYIPGNGDSDMSTTQWAVLASIYGQSLGATTPAAVVNSLKNWLTAVQAADGGACYQPGVGPCDQADTGGMLMALDFVGKTTADTPVQKALTYLNNNWTQGANGTWYGNFNQPYSMWAQYKGLELNIGLGNTSAITNLLDSTCGGDSPTTCNWWQDYNEWLVNTQSGDGSWGGYAYWYGPLATAYFLPILGGAEIPIPNPDPEPETLVLLATGLFLLARSRQRKAGS
ncbi:MAG: hypothetical protein NTU86_10950 [Burkholderiales bacterium]|nr:hypothetical protein [Burkholderiales bacterium]